MLKCSKYKVQVIIHPCRHATANRSQLQPYSLPAPYIFLYLHQLYYIPQLYMVFSYYISTIPVYDYKLILSRASFKF